MFWFLLTESIVLIQQPRTYRSTSFTLKILAEQAANYSVGIYFGRHRGWRTHHQVQTMGSQAGILDGLGPQWNTSYKADNRLQALWKQPFASVVD